MEGTPDLGHHWSSLVTSLAAHRQPAPQPAPPEQARAGAPSGRPTTPVSLLTGFLGAGKSTLLAGLLSDPGDVGVIRAVVNDVGRLRFDPTLIDSSDRATIELTNGCGCCIAGAATELGERLDEVAVGADLVVLEASGLADPRALAQVVEARSVLRLARTVAVVDATAVGRLLGLPAVAPLLRRQLGSAEVIVLSHTDDVSPDEAAATTASIAELAPGSPVVPSTAAEPAHRVLRPGFRIGVSLGSRSESVGAEPVTRSFEAGLPISGSALRSVLDLHRRRLLRVKGRVVVDGTPTLVQLTPSGLLLTPDRDGPLGITAVAIDQEAWPDLARLFGVG